MMELQVGKNIRTLRNSFGETQAELGSIIGVTGSEVSMIENGKRLPSIDNLIAISNHYHVPIDYLIKEKIILSKKLDSLTITKDCLSSAIDVLYPIVETEEAIKDSNFLVAYRRHKNIYSTIRNKLLVDVNVIYNCYMSYEKSWLESNTIESAANMIGLMILIYSSISDVDIIKLVDRINTFNYIGKETFKRTFCGVQNSREKEQQKIEFISDNWGTLIEYLKVLKNTNEWSNLADYYLALSYIVGFAEGDIHLNKIIGKNMMDMFTILGNNYCLNYTVLLFSFFDD